MSSGAGERHSGGGGPPAVNLGMLIPRDMLALGRRIGAGSFGVVYEAKYMKAATVAVKVPPPPPPSASF